MKHLSLILLAALTFEATAQTMFNVDMTCAPEFDNVFVTGPFCGWCANEDYNTLTDDDGDGIYTVVIEDLTGTVEYKYAINGFADHENLVNDMVDGATCAPVTDYSVYANRQTEAGSTTSDYYGTCDGTCNDLPGGAITFQVDMAGYTGTYSSVNLNGSFNGWCGSCAVMTDDDGDGVYSIEVGLDAGTVEYKFTLDGWTDQEMFAEGTSCTSTIDGYTNRTFDVTGGDVVLDVVCWNLCTGCVAEPVTGCSADFDFMGELFGLSPNPTLGETFVEGQVNLPYEDVLHVIWPTSTGAIPGAPLDVPLDSLILDSLSLVGEMGETITLLEVGLSMSPNNNGDSGNPNAFLGGGQYCASVTGMPDTAGVFLGQFFTTAWVTIPVVGPNAIPFPLEGYTLVINPEPVPGCTDETACNYDENATGDDGSCFYAAPLYDCDGNCLNDPDGDGICNDVDGCTDSSACNFDASATMDDGSCTFVADYYDCDGNCLNDGDGDGVCDELEVPGCTLLGASNYDATATEDDGSCLYNESETLLFMETFSNGFAGDNGVGSWTVSDNGGDSIWVAVGPDGFGTYYDGSPTNAVHPAGEFSTNIGPLASVTAANGWVIFDNDFYNTPISDGYQDTEGALTSPSLDFGNVGSVLVNWESYFRYCCYPYAPVYLEVGVTEGGVTSWTTFDAHGDFIESANTASPNPLPVRVDISCAAAYQSDVQLRFAYRQAPETGTAYSHYYWGIDDVVVTSNDVVNDMAITQVTNGDVYNVWEYRNTPIEQAISVADGGLVAGLMYRNMGTANQTNVNVLVEILNNQGTVVHQVSETLEEVLTLSNAPSCPANEQDTLFIATGWEPNQVGTYTLRISMFGDQNDQIPANNTLSKEFKYSPETYAHDNENVLDGELRPRESDDIADYFDPTGYGSFYHFPNEGSVAYGVAVRFGPNCGLDMSGSIRDLEFETRLYSMDGSSTITDSPFDSAYWIYNPEWSNPEGTSDVEIYLPFDDPIALGTWPAEGQYYFASVINEFESAAELTVLAELDSDTDNSTGQFSQSGSGEFVWFTSQTATPSVRLITAPMGCQDPEACNYQSGASMGGASCDYSSCLGCTDDMACNYDSEATVEDGSCDYSCFGCTDSTAVNWNPNASIDDGSCVYFVTSCSFLGHEGWDELAAGLYADSAMWHYVGSEASGEWVLSLPTTIQEPSSGSTFAVSSWSGLSMTNLPPGLEVADFPESLEGGEQACLSYSGVPTTAGQYPIMVSGNMTVLLFGSPYEVGNFSVVASMDIFPNPNPIPGCTYSNAANFVLFANQDDGSCEFWGCMDNMATNYQPLATVDDGTCLYDECVSTCPTDLNGDGVVGTPDLLLLLSTFGLECN